MVRIVLLRLLESYFRHRWLYILPVVIAVAAGGAYVATIPPEYTASGRLYVAQENLLANLTSSNTGGSFWISAADATVSEIYELMNTQAFIRSVIQKTDLEQNMSAGPEAVYNTITYVRDIVSIQSAGDKLVDIAATGDDPNVVYQVVISMMDAYVQWKINSGYQESIAARSFFDNLMKPYQDEVEQSRSDLVAFLTSHPEPARGDRPPAEQMELDRLQALVQRAEDRLSSARDNEENARLAQVQSESVTKQTYMVIDQPQIPEEAKVSTKAIAMNLVIFMIVGIFLAIVGIVGGALLDRSLRFPIDVRHGLSLPVLAMIPTGQTIPPQAVTADQSAASSAAAVKETSDSGDTSVLQPQI